MFDRHILTQSHLPVGKKRYVALSFQQRHLSYPFPTRAGWALMQLGVGGTCVGVLDKVVVVILWAHSIS